MSPVTSQVTGKLRPSSVFFSLFRSFLSDNDRGWPQQKNRVNFDFSQNLAEVSYLNKNIPNCRSEVKKKENPTKENKIPWTSTKRCFWEVTRSPSSLRPPWFPKHPCLHRACTSYGAADAHQLPIVPFEGGDGLGGWISITSLTLCGESTHLPSIRWFTVIFAEFQGVIGKWLWMEPPPESV